MRKVKILVFLVLFVFSTFYISAAVVTDKTNNSDEQYNSEDDQFLSKVKDLLKNNKPKEAKEMLQEKIDRFNKFDNSPKDGKMFLDFNEPLERVIYDLYLNPEKLDVVQTEEHMVIYYYYYSYALYELGEFEVEKDVLKRAIELNPAYPVLYFEYCECLKKLGEMDDLFPWTRAAFQVSYYEYDVAHCYRNFGYYFIEKGQYDVATWCYLISLEFEEDYEKVLGELSYIEYVTGKEIVYPTAEELESIKAMIGFDYFCIPDIEGIE